MNSKRSAAEWVWLTVVPVLLLLVSSLYLVMTEAFHISPYLMLCLSGLFAISACLLWGAGLCARMVRSGARQGMMMTSVLLFLWVLLYFLQGMLSTVSGAAELLQMLTLLPQVCLPAALYRTFRCAVHSQDEQDADRCFWLLLVAGAVCFVVVLCFWMRSLPLAASMRWGLCVAACVGAFVMQILLLLKKTTVRIIPAALVLVAEAVVFVCAAMELGGFRQTLLAYVAPLLVFLFCEGGFWAELIPDGRMWPELLQNTTFPLQLMDGDGTILYESEGAHPIAPNHKAAILNNRYHVSQILERDTQLSAAVIRGGYALHQKDLRDLHALQTALDAITRELESTANILSQESEIEEKLQKTMEKTAFFAEQEKKIQEKTDQASLLLRCAAAADPEPGFRRAVVTRANLLVTYIQQLGMLLEAARETEEMPVHHLKTALEASAKAATAAGARCRVYHVAQGTFSAELMLSLYDLYEQVLEDLISGDQQTLEIRLRNEQSGLRLILTIKDTALDTVSNRIEHILAKTSEMGGTARFTMDGRDVSVCIEFLEGGAKDA